MLAAVATACPVLPVEVLGDDGVVAGVGVVSLATFVETAAPVEGPAEPGGPWPHAPRGLPFKLTGPTLGDFAEDAGTEMSLLEAGDRQDVFSVLSLASLFRQLLAWSDRDCPVETLASFELRGADFPPRPPRALDDPPYCRMVSAAD